MNLLLLILILVISVVAFRFLKPRVTFLMTGQKAIILAGVYIIILILSVPILYALPDDELIDITQPTKEDQLFGLKLATKEELESQPGVYQRSQETFKVSGNTLWIKSDYGLGWPVILERKDVEDGEVEVTVYSGHHLVGNVDYSAHTIPPKVDYENNILLVQKPPHKRIDFKQFRADTLTANQLKQANVADQSNFSYFFNGDFSWKAIHLFVPKNMKVIGESYGP